jgi:hypothetical protein
MGKALSRLLGFALVVCVVSVIAYISLLGENDRAAATVKSYFNNIAGKHYDANTHLCSRHFNSQFNNLNDPITYQFSLETALLNHFGLINTAQYKTETKRNEFWIPYIKPNSLHISIEIHPKGSTNILTNLFQPDNKAYLDNFVTLVREDGRWKIDDMNIKSKAIARDFQRTKASMQNSRYMRQTAHGFILKENTIKFSEMDPIQKRILTFNLNKALTLLKDQEQPPSSITK